MLSSHKEKEISKADMQKKVDAWKTINSVLVSSNAQYMNSLRGMLTEKKAQLSQLEEKLKSDSENATEEDNAKLLFLGGYVQCLEDILNAKKTTEN
jgi:hypothetical protein